MIVKDLVLRDAVAVGLLAAGILLVNGTGLPAEAQGIITINDSSFENGLGTIPYSTTINSQWQE